MFWRYGFLNAVRNLGRSGLALLSMLLAAGFLTNAVSLSRGYVQLYRADHRFLAGGEVSVYAPQFGAAVPQGDEAWLYHRFSGMEQTDLGDFQPELLRNGYLNLSERVVEFDAQKIEALAAVEGVAAVYPTYRLPGQLIAEPGSRSVALRGRDFDLDQMQARSPQILVSEGRWFNEQDEGELRAVVCSRQHYQQGEKAIGVGDLLTLKLPRAQWGEDGYRFDYGEPVLLRFSVIGIIDPVSRSITLEDGTMESDLFRLCDEIFIPLSTWQAIWSEVGAGAYRPRQLQLIVPDISYLADTVTDLRARFPEHSFVDVAEQADRTAGRMFYEDFRDLVAVRGRDHTLRAAARRPVEVQNGLPQDLRLPLVLLVFANAAFVVAGNLLIIANERREEIGIFKTLGATRFHVAQMVLAEALIISCLGALLGFLIFRFPAVLNQLTNDVSAGQLLFGIIRDMLLVLAASASAAIVFAMLPALRMANLSVLDAFRDK